MTRPVSHVVAADVQLTAAVDRAWPPAGRWPRTWWRFVPGAQILFAGAMCSFGAAPLCWQGDPARWADELDRLVELAPDRGAGPRPDRRARRRCGTSRPTCGPAWPPGGDPAGSARGRGTTGADREHDVVNVERAALLADGRRRGAAVDAPPRRPGLTRPDVHSLFVGVPAAESKFAGTLGRMLFGRDKQRMPGPDDALPGRDHRVFEVPATHAVLGTPLEPPFPDGMERAVFGLGCFWGAERLFWQVEGVYSTAVGYAGGYTPNPTYEEVCSGRTGHTEVVLVVFDPDRGRATTTCCGCSGRATTRRRACARATTWARSTARASRCADDVQRKAAEASRDAYQQELTAAGYGQITTEIVDAAEFWYAEDYHQQYLHKNPIGYCGLGGTGVSCPVGLTG